MNTPLTRDTEQTQMASIQSSGLNEPSEAPPSKPEHSRMHAGDTPSRAVMHALSPKRISLVYVLIAIVALFGIWKPHVFLTTSNFESILDNNAFNAIAAVGLVLCFSAFQFDLAVGAEINFGMIVAAELSFHHMPVGEVLLATVGVGICVGLAHAFLVNVARVDSFVATIGTSSILAALTLIVSGGNDIIGLGSGFTGLTTHKVLGLQISVVYMLVIALLVYYVLERTPLGRRIYATGDNADAARLSGVRTSWMITGAFVAASAIALLSGALLASADDTGDPTIGPQLLLPVFTACFLGSTQFKPGRFNVWGTVLAIYVLAIGVAGVDEVTSVTWLPDMFNGAALIIAVAAARFQSTPGQFAAIRRLIGSVRRSPAPAASSGSGAPEA